LFRDGKSSTSQLPQEFLLVHAVLEGLAAIDEDDGDFVVELAAKFGIKVNVNFVPGEATAARKLAETFFYYFAKMTSLAGVDHDVARVGHVWDSSAGKSSFPATK
jgi:hypothetical protein